MASSSGGAADRIVRKAGEGYDKPNADQELPIDINYQKLAEWLVSGRVYTASQPTAHHLRGS
jgi:hypothetical protein